MKNKTILIGLSLVMLSSLAAYAEERRDGDNFSARKAEIMSHLSKEKSIIDAMISCVNSASKKEEIERCSEQRKASHGALRQEREAMEQKRMAERREHLQKELKELDDKASRNAASDRNKSVE
ncbi:MAG: hypothetical protein FJX34_03535 [Alphaproteobacteria bacterium]|nr:hypothetical protein [Alphaproteobacteria bacterium]